MKIDYRKSTKLFWIKQEIKEEVNKQIKEKYEKLLPNNTINKILDTSHPGYSDRTLLGILLNK